MPPLNAPERIVEHTVQLPNATWRLIGVRPAWTRYLLLTFRCTALSDEKRDSEIGSRAYRNGLDGQARLDESGILAAVYRQNTGEHG